MSAGTARPSRWTLAALAPGAAVLARYQRSWLRPDVTAGIAVAAYLIPQAIAYAGLVGVPAVAALWVAVAAMVVYAVLGSSARLSVGPESTVALLAGSVVAPLAGGSPARAAALSAALALLVAGWLAVGWVVRLGVAADLLSHPLLVGYLTGAAVLMIVGQLGRMTGTSVTGDTVPAEVSSFIAQLPATSMPTLAVGVGTLAVLLVISRISPRAPAPLIAVTLATVASAALGLSGDGVAVLGPVPSGLPDLSVPLVGVSDLTALAVPALGVAVVAFGDNTLVGRAFARRGERFDANSELLALSGVHVAAGLIGGFPVSSSGSRTALAVTSHARTQAYSLVAAVVVATVVLAAGGMLASLPLASLGAVVVYAALRLVDTGEYRWLWTFRRSEVIVAAVTALGTLTLGILPGVGIAVALSVVEMVARLSRPPDAIQGLVPGLAGMHDVDDYPEARTVPGLVVYRYDAPLFFINAEDCHRQALEAVGAYGSDEAPVRWLVLNVEANMHVDATAVRMLRRLRADLAEQGVRLGLARLKHDLELQLDAAGLLEEIGRDMVFPTLPVMVAAFDERVHSLTSQRSPFGPGDAVGVGLVRDGRMLVVRTRSRPALWQPPGGRIEPGEQALDAAVRELAEATGWCLDPSELREVMRLPMDVRDGELAFYLARAPEGDVPALDPVEVAEVAWVTRQEALRLPALPAAARFLAYWAGQSSVADPPASRGPAPAQDAPGRG